jgi:serine/threonine protein kinase
MERCDPIDLEREINQHDHLNTWFTEKQIVNIMKQLINGCKALNDCGIIHRDLKPSNIMVKDGIYKVPKYVYIDWGFRC